MIKLNSYRTMIWISIMAALGAHTSSAVESDFLRSRPCDPEAVGQLIETAMGKSWNKGSVRAWNEEGEFWSMPLPDNSGKSLSTLTEVLKSKTSEHCFVHIADQGSYTARVTPRETFNASISAASASAVNELSCSQEKFISSLGTTIGVLAPTPRELVLIMYPAKIASAIARGQGTTNRTDLKEILPHVPPELDIEYNFGGVQVAIFGGTGKLTMREASDLLFKQLRHMGYQPDKGSIQSVASFDGLFAPGHHESFWRKDSGVLRLELEKQKNGQVRVSLHETNQKKR